ncbi:MAG: PLP-dependent aminotransferase family protein [Pseudonocardia sp.]|nr:PLP-dependent aminotransferase family protein [Pseudonocardia sp.]
MAGSELLVKLQRESGQPLWAQLEEALRESIHSGRLAPGAKLPPTRVLAGDLGVSRRLVVEAYAQLLAERYLVARRGAGTYVAEVSAATSGSADEPPATTPLSYDFFPGHPDLAGFPWRPWLRAMSETIAAVPHRRLGYDDVRGALELRHALAEHLRRVRGVVADPRRIVVCSGAAQGLVLLARALDAPHVAMEDPSWPQLRRMLAAHGARVSALPVDADGAQIAELAPIERALGRPSAVFVTPAHQSPTGVALAPQRRAALLDWAKGGGLVIEDDYDAEFRYDRPPLAALQGLAPERVIYMGSASKTLAPALRLGWLVLPTHLVQRVVEQRDVADRGAPTLEQMALARMIESGAYHRHLRQARKRYRARREALIGAVNRHLRGARVTGLAAGLHAIIRVPQEVAGAALVDAARRRSVGVYPLGGLFMNPRPVHDQLALGYANLTESSIEEGIRRLADAVRECMAASVGTSSPMTSSGRAIQSSSWCGDAVEAGSN